MHPGRLALATLFALLPVPIMWALARMEPSLGCVPGQPCVGWVLLLFAGFVLSFIKAVFWLALGIRTLWSAVR